MSLIYKVLERSYEIFENALLSFKSAFLSLITRVTNVALRQIANICAVNTSTFMFNLKLDKTRLANSKLTLEEMGMKPLLGIDHAYIINAGDLIKLFQDKGAEITSIQDVDYLEFDNSNQYLLKLCEKMHVPLKFHDKKCRFPITIPKNQTVIYSPGSGHIFEFRKKTISYFLLRHGLNVVIYHYPGVMGAKGQVDQTTIQNRALQIAQNLLASSSEKDIVLYGHCIGANFMQEAIKLSSKIRVIVDRAFNTTQQLTANSISKKWYNFVPGLNDALARKGQEFFNFDLKGALGVYKDQKQLILYSSNDAFVPPSDKDKDDSFLKNRECIDLGVDHDNDLTFGTKADSSIKKVLSD